MIRRLWWAWFLGAVLIGCAGMFPKPKPCEPKACAVWKFEEVQARKSLRREFGCDEVALEANPEGCDARWRHLEDAMSRVAWRCVEIEAGLP